ncbi:class I adenylate-forming enzyme family protein [Rhodococcus erythropolis]
MEHNMGTSLAWITDSVSGQSPVISPDHPAVALDDQVLLSWGELREAELQYACALKRAGVGRGDRVGILLRNSVDYIVQYLAIARVGAISVRLNPRLTTPELQFVLEDSGTEYLLFDAEFLDTIESLRAHVPTHCFVMAGIQTSTPEWALGLNDFLRGGEEVSRTNFPEMGLDDPVSLLYTSGTTGRPKGAIWTHGGTMWFAAMQALKWGFDHRTVTLTPGPLFHAGGLEALLMPALVCHGTAVTFTTGGFSIERLLQVARARQVTMMLLYSFMAYDFLRLPEVRTLIPSTMQRIVCGGDTLMPWVYDEFERLLPGIEVIQQYGLTEGGAVSTCLDHADARGREGSVGLPLPFSEFKVVDGAGGSVPAGEVGEVWVRSPAVSAGYWQRPAETAATFREGWCATGDLGTVDGEGFLTLAGRAKDMIRSGGENIYPAEIEATLTAYPGIADAAVVGVPDPKYLEVGCAVLVPTPGLAIDVDAVRSYCAERLAGYKIPRYFQVIDELPRTPAGKIKKYELRQQYSARS